MPRSLSKWVLRASLLAGGLALACATERGLEPKPVRYNIYANENHTGNIYVIDADSLTVVDSIPGMGYVDNMVASADGRYLFAQLWATRTVKIDVLTKSIVASYPDDTFSNLFLLNEGRLLIRERCQLEHIDPATFRITFVDSTRICEVTGAPHGTRVVGSRPDQSRLLVYDSGKEKMVADFEARTLEGTPVAVYCAALHPDGRRVLVLGRESYDRTVFLVVDVATESTLFQYPLAMPFGEIGISPDGTRALVTDPGQPEFDQTVGTLDVFYLDELKHVVRFNRFWGYTQAVHRIRFLPNTTIAVIAPYWKSPGHLWTLNWRTLLPEGRVWEQGYESFGDVAVGLCPEQQAACARH